MAIDEPPADQDQTVRPGEAIEVKRIDTFFAQTNWSWCATGSQRRAAGGLEGSSKFGIAAEVAPTLT
jgi:hypothetical protein